MFLIFLILAIGIVAAAIQISGATVPWLLFWFCYICWMLYVAATNIEIQMFDNNNLN